MKFSLFRKTEHKTFTHVPIYYNEKEEERKERERNAQIELGEERETTDDDYTNRMKGSMRRYAHQHQSATQFSRLQKKQSNLRVVIILAILFFILYLLWKYTDAFIQFFMR